MANENKEVLTEDEQKLVDAIKLQASELIEKKLNGVIAEDTFNKAIKDIAEKATKESEATKDEVLKSITELKDAMVKQGNEITALKEIGSKQDAAIKSELHPIALQIKELANKGELSFASSGLSSAKSITTKAPVVISNMVSANIETPDYIPGVTEIPVEQNNIISYATPLPTNGMPKRTTVYWDKVGVNGNAEVVDCGQPKPIRNFRTEERKVSALKIAVREVVCDEDLLFGEGLMQLIEDDMFLAIKQKRNSLVVNLIQANANLYNLTALTTTNPNYKDAIRAGIAQVRSLNYKPTHVFLNPIDAANFEMEKGVDGHYMHICECNPQVGFSISSLIVIETTEIPQGYFLVGDMKRLYYKFLTEILFFYGKGINIADDGTVVSDLNNNLTTFIAEQYLNMFIKTIEGNAFVYDSFANVVSAL